MNLYYPKMPVITRSATGPTKKMVGVKRKFIEILDSDDDTTTVCSDSDSEYQPGIADVLEDEIDELKDDLKESEQSNEALINILIKERETIQTLQTELADTTAKYDRLVNNVKEIQKTAWIEFIMFTSMLAITAGASLAAYVACSEEQYIGFRFQVDFYDDCVCGLKTKRDFSLMDADYREYDNTTELSSGWKEGVAAGLIVGVILGASVIGLIGLSVCPNV